MTPTQLHASPLPKVLFFTADPVLALEVQALHLSYATQFNISCKRQLSDLKTALENYFYEVLFLDISYLSDPIGMINIVNKLSPATFIFIIDSTGGSPEPLLEKMVNQSRVHRFFSRPFNFTTWVKDLEQAITNARAYNKNLYNTAPIPMVISDDLPNVILLHSDFHFGAKVRSACADIAQISWAANLNDLGLLLQKYEPWAIIVEANLAAGNIPKACFAIHQKFPNIIFGMVTQSYNDNKIAIAEGINYFALEHVASGEALLEHTEDFFSPLFDGYEKAVSHPWRNFARQSLAWEDVGAEDEATADFLLQLDFIDY